jgi:hypothetical protein
MQRSWIRLEMLGRALRGNEENLAIALAPDLARMLDCRVSPPGVMVVMPPTSETETRVYIYRRRLQQ